MSHRSLHITGLYSVIWFTVIGFLFFLFWFLSLLIFSSTPCARLNWQVFCQFSNARYIISSWPTVLAYCTSGKCRSWKQTYTDTVNSFSRICVKTYCVLFWPKDKSKSTVFFTVSIFPLLISSRPVSLYFTIDSLCPKLYGTCRHVGLLHNVIFYVIVIFCFTVKCNYLKP